MRREESPPVPTPRCPQPNNCHFSGPGKLELESDVDRWAYPRSRRADWQAWREGGRYSSRTDAKLRVTKVKSMPSKLEQTVDENLESDRICCQHPNAEGLEKNSKHCRGPSLPARKHCNHGITQPQRNIVRRIRSKASPIYWFKNQIQGHRPSNKETHLYGRHRENIARLCRCATVLKPTYVNVCNPTVRVPATTLRQQPGDKQTVPTVGRFSYIGKLLENTRS